MLNVLGAVAPKGVLKRVRIVEVDEVHLPTHRLRDLFDLGRQLVQLRLRQCEVSLRPVGDPDTAGEHDEISRDFIQSEHVATLLLADGCYVGRERLENRGCLELFRINGLFERVDKIVV